MKRPAPVPWDANIRYNALVREQLAQRNANIAADNTTRRAEVRLTVVASPEASRQGGGGSAP